MDEAAAAAAAVAAAAAAEEAAAEPQKAAEGASDEAVKEKELVENLEAEMVENAEKEAEPQEKADTKLTGKAMRPLVVITSSYLLFTITDGAIRMIVLLHAYNESFSAMQVAMMFTLYEVAGMMTNLAAGMIGAKWGLKMTLIAGLSLQLGGLGMLFGWRGSWDKTTAIVYVTLASGLSGVAKDLTKLGGKTVTKLVTPDEKEGRLFKIVSLVTGMKNSLKGFGYFLGSLLLSVDDEWGYYLALSVLCLLILAAMPGAFLCLSFDLGKVRSSNVKFRDAFMGYPPNLYWLSAARMFLFMSRDMWFEVPLPFYLRSPSCGSVGLPCFPGDNSNMTCAEGTECVGNGTQGYFSCAQIGDGCGGLALDKRLVGTMLACYIIFYGQIQSWTPVLVTTPINRHNDTNTPNRNTELLWGALNMLPTLMMFLVLRFSSAFDEERKGEMIAVVICGLIWFAFVFAVNSSIHSFLVVKYAEGNKAAQSVGFYYMSNAAGRLMGTIVSGAVYSYASDSVTDNLSYCMLLGTGMSAIALLFTLPITDKNAPVGCGPCITLCGEFEREGEGGNEGTATNEPAAGS